MKLSPQKAIYNHCKNCIYDPAEKGNWVEQVENCKITQCELYEHRKLTSKTRRLQRENYLASLPPSERAIVEKRSQECRERLLILHNKAEV
jgi:hypothetical protein